jgi:hypothetical protein
MEQFDTIETVLVENFEKETDLHPDWRGDINLFDHKYNASGWLKTITKGEKIGQEFVSLNFQLNKDKNDDINVACWKKLNRASSSEPHFKGRLNINGDPLVFSAWIGFDEEERGTLRVSVSQGSTEPTQVAKANRQKMAKFLKEADGVNPLNTVRTAAPSRTASVDEETSEIPF